MSRKRILKEFQNLQTSKPHGIQVSLPSDNMQIWEAEFAAPEQSLYKGAQLKIQLILPENYPLSPPSHVNISQPTGHVCLGFLNQEKWIPTNRIEDALQAIFSLLINPQEDAAQNQQILTEFRDSSSVYKRKAIQSAKKLG